MKQALKTLKRISKNLSPQQYRTFKGQILKGDIEGFRKVFTRFLLKGLSV